MRRSPLVFTSSETNCVNVCKVSRWMNEDRERSIKVDVYFSNK